ncbi:MAG: hypothetical protein ACW97O_06650, partial [Candidatus Thorarchaeota archaeon]
MEDIAVYRALQEHMDKTPFGFPSTESGSDIRLLKQLFTPEEALIATYLTYSTYPIDDLDTIHSRIKSTDITIEDLEEVLDKMVGKGLLHFKSEGGKKFYNNAQWIVGIYEFQVERLTKELLNAIGDYHNEAYTRVPSASQLTQLRVIPVQKSFTPDSPVAHYDDIRKLTESADGPFMVAKCICREAYALKDDPCKVTDREETC